MKPRRFHAKATFNLHSKHVSVCQNDLINRHGLCCFVGLIVCPSLMQLHSVSVRRLHYKCFSRKIHEFQSCLCARCILKRRQQFLSKPKPIPNAKAMTMRGTTVQSSTEQYQTVPHTTEEYRTVPISSNK